MADDHNQDDENDPNNPLNSMFPSKGDNPEYHRKKAAHEERIGSAAEQGVVSDPTFAGMSDRMQRVRKNIPQASTPQPAPKTEVPPLAPPVEPAPGTGLEVDPQQAATSYTPVEPRLPEGAVVAPPTTAQAPPPAAPAPASGNPILAKLRADFGIESIPTADVTLGDSTFTLRILDTGSVSMAVRFADTISMSDRESVLNLQLSCVAFCIQAIDGAPLWQVFDIPVEDEQKIMVQGAETFKFAPMSPPPTMRIQAATQFMDFLATEAAPSLCDELWKAYGEKIDHQGTLAGIVERLKGDEEGEEPENIPLP